MAVMEKILLLLACCLACVHADTLLISSVTFRHGDRSSIGTFPNNTCDETCWPQGYGQLTQRGMRQHYIFGQYLRQHYMYDNPLLNSSYYISSQMTVRSTDVDRTLMSAQSLLSSFYPPSGFQVFEPSLPWMPLPVHTVPAHNDSLLRAYDMAENACPRYTKLYNDIPTLQGYKDAAEANKEFIDDVAKKAQVDYPLTLQNIYLVEDPLFCQSQHNISQPEWVTGPVLDKLHMLGGFSMQLMFWTKEMHRLTAGVLIGQMLQNMKNRSINESLPTQNLFLYSAHDTTVAALLNALEIYNGMQPPYASSVLIELWRPDDSTGPEDDYVKVLYRNVTDTNSTEPVDLTSSLPMCMNLDRCLLSSFSAYYQPIVVTNWYDACHDATSSSLSSVVIGTISVACVFFVAFLILLALVVNRKRSDYVKVNP